MLKPLIQIALKLLRLKLKTKSVIIQAPMESMRQSVMYYNADFGCCAAYKTNLLPVSLLLYCLNISLLHFVWC